MNNTFGTPLLDFCTKSVETKLNEIGYTVAPFETRDTDNRRKIYKDGVEIDNLTAYEAMEKYLGWKNK